MLLSLTSKEFDMAGALLLDVPSHDFGDTRRRMSRVATLDGGAAVNDFGFTDADRTIVLTWSATASEDESVRRMVELHQRVRLSSPVGLLECVIDSYAVRNDRSILTLLAVERLSG